MYTCLFNKFTRFLSGLVTEFSNIRWIHSLLVCLIDKTSHANPADYLIGNPCVTNPSESVLTDVSEDGIGIEPMG